MPGRSIQNPSAKTNAAMQRNRIIQLVTALLIVATVFGAGGIGTKVRAERKELQLGLEGQLDESVPADIVLAYTMFGAFRGMIVDWMWHRATEMKDQGKHYEAYRLAENITKLMHNFPDVWRFHAWNMAFNISVTTHTPEERWDWVHKGIRLLREEGIRYNPNSEMLYKELAWIFFFKVGGNTDDQHWYYKRRMAFEWHEVLGDLYAGRTAEQGIELFRRIVGAPLRTKDWLDADPAHAQLANRIAEMGHKLDEELLRQLGYHLMFLNSYNSRLYGAPVNMDPERFDEQIMALIQDQKLAEVGQSLLSHLRHKIIVQRYYMDPQFMLELMELYGPIDWRHPAAHGLYWSELGVRVAEGARYKADIDLLNLNRHSMHSLQDLSKTGRISYDPVGPPGSYGTLYRGPEAQFYLAYERALAEATLRLESDEYKSSNARAYLPGHENFIAGAITSSYMTGNLDIAARLYQSARTAYGRKNPDRWMKGIEHVIRKTYEDTIRNQADAERFITERLMFAFQHGFAYGRRQLAVRNIDLARQVHATIQDRAQQNATTVQDPKMLLPWPQVASLTFAQYMSRAEFDVISRARAWVNADPILRLMTYDLVAPSFKPELEANRIDPNRIIPEPPGIEEFRKQQQKNTTDPAKSAAGSST